VYLDDGHNYEETALNAEWDIDYSQRTFGSFPKIELESTLEHRIHDDAGYTCVEGTINNHNVTEKRLWVLVKFTSRWNTVLETVEVSVRIPGNGSEKFTVSPNLALDREEKIRDYEIQLSQSPY
jgi:hypothetical protein